MVELSRLELLVMIVATGIAWLLLAAGLIHLANVRWRRHLAPPKAPEPLPELEFLAEPEPEPEPEPDTEPRAVVILTASVPSRGRGPRDG